MNEVEKNEYLFLITIITPHYVTRGENLKRRAEDVGFDPTGMTIKSSRKTWESGLYRYIPSKNKLIIGRFNASQ